MESLVPNEEIIRNIMFYRFIKKECAIRATKNICDIMGDILDVRKCQRWFKQFKSGNFNLRNNPGRGRPVKVDGDVLAEIIQQNPTTTIQKLADQLGCSRSCVQEHMKKIGMIRKQGKWIPHELSEENQVKSSKAEWTQIQEYFQEKEKDSKKKTRRKRRKVNKDDPLDFLHSSSSEKILSSNCDQDKKLNEIHEHTLPHDTKLIEIKKEIDHSGPIFDTSYVMDQEMENSSSSKDTHHSIDRSLHATVPMDQFFSYMCEKTKLLPINIQLDLKRKILNVVCDAEKAFISDSFV